MEKDHTRQFVEHLGSLKGDKNRAEMFRDFCEMGYCALVKATLPKERGDEIEARYMAIVESYRDKDVIREYPKLLALVQFGICSGEDVLGVASAEVGVLAKDQGQFFTPFAICKLMAEITLAEASDMVAQKGFVTLCEPTIGAGALVLASADVMHRQGLDPAVHLLADVTDLSQLCYYMAYIQLTLKGIPAYVRHGNTLSGEAFDGAWTFGASDFYRKHGRLFPKGESPRSEPGTQPSLFT